MLLKAFCGIRERLPLRLLKKVIYRTKVFSEGD